jgi:signal transduction histidine kinase
MSDNARTRILVIDDVASDRMLAIRELRHSFPDAEVTEILDATDLERELRACNFQLVITDYELKWSNGLDVIRRLKQRCPDIPIIMFTGSGNQEVAVEAMKLGCADYVVKSTTNYPRVRFAGKNAVDRANQLRVLRETEKLAVIGRLMATIAHEINNPLDNARGLLYLIAKDRESEKASELLDTAQQELARIEQITSRTLGFYRESPHPVPVDLAKILEDVLVIYAGRLRHQGVTVSRQYQDGTVCTYPGEMRQVLSNLIGNALDVMEKGGSLEVGTRLAPKDWVELWIADSGPGISPENLDRIFEPFYTTKGEKGTGLGLWITREIVTKLGGTITANPRGSLGGATFELRLPVSAPSEKEQG